MLYFNCLFSPLSFNVFVLGLIYFLECIPLLLDVLLSVLAGIARVTTSCTSNLSKDYVAMEMFQRPLQVPNSFYVCLAFQKATAALDDHGTDFFLCGK